MPDSFLKFILEPLSKRLHKYVNTHPRMVGFTKSVTKARSKWQPEDITTPTRTRNVRMRMLQQKKIYEKTKARQFSSFFVISFELIVVTGVFFYKKKQLYENTIEPIKKEIEISKEAIKEMVTAEQLEKSKSAMILGLKEILSNELIKYKKEIKRDVDDMIEAKLKSVLEKSEAKVNGKTKVDEE